jgi:hypothetical protein
MTIIIAHRKPAYLLYNKNKYMQGEVVSSTGPKSDNFVI